ncbi:phage/plasmid replication domain-containing protein [Chryseobacterium sp. 22532]|uniref:phage/plasmid replication domain-containing protein n=1 Tax=Chryseobacterium sp. 22532 TaxID=3453938 RepID=UPI003F876694
MKKGNPNNPALFWVRNFRVTTRNKKLIIEGSLAKYFNGNNIEPFSWLDVKSAIKKLSFEIDLPLEEGILRRVDIGMNFSVNKDVVEYFPEMFHLHCYQRIHKHKTTLRFENNSHRFNFCFYDKKRLVLKSKRNYDDFELISEYQNLMRIELQIEEGLQLFLKRTEPVKVSELFSRDFCKLLLKKWLRLYRRIQKRGVKLFPTGTKGREDFDLLMRREFIETYGWEYLEYRLEQLVKQGSFTRGQKCEKKKQFTRAMLDKRPFIYQEHVNELNRKVNIMLFEIIDDQLFNMPETAQKLVK